LSALRKAARVVYLNVATVCVLLAALELSGQVVYFVAKGYPLFERDRHVLVEGSQNPFEVHPFLVARLKQNVKVSQDGKTVTTTSDHTRWTGAPVARANVINVALLGGSTTFGSGMTDVDTWPAQLQAILGPDYAVTNYGMPGYSSTESIIQLALVVPENRPRVIVLYEGWNDIHNYHDAELGGDYYRHGMRQYSNLGIERPRPRGLVAKLADISSLFYFPQVVSRRADLGSFSTAPTNDAYPTPDQDADPNPDPVVDRLYVRNLLTQKALVRHLGAFVFFVPQVMNASRFKGPSGSAWTPHVRNEAMPRLTARFNGFMDGVCTAREAGCAVLKDATDRTWLPDDFIDEGHFSREGNRKFARLIASSITALGREPGPSTVLPH
jgi:lysophospholipase L1-like esterase